VASFDKATDILSKQRYLAGNRFTLADIRLFVTLVRFDEVYNVYFKINSHSVRTTPALLNYCREIYQMPGVKETVNMHQIKHHYYCSHPDYNRWSIVPHGPNFVGMLDKKHDRGEMSSSKKRKMENGV
jgi:putative glutathione S-transferase